MGSCMSSPAEEPKKAVESKPAPTPPAAGESPTSPTSQGLDQALADAPEKGQVKDRSNVIDRQLEDDSKKFKKECKILLLGE